MRARNPLIEHDFYKNLNSHRLQYEKGTELVYCNFTPRGSRLESNYVVALGFQRYFMQLNELWEPFFEDLFFASKCIEQYVDICKRSLMTDIDTKPLWDLHKLGYLPLQCNAVEEGTLIPVRVPVLSMWNTHKDFYWLPQCLETHFSSEMWKIMTSATQAREFRVLFNECLKKTGGNPEDAQYMGHNFSYRGCSHLQDAISVDMGHLSSFSGTDTIPGIEAIDYYYGKPEQGSWGGSIMANEHSVTCLSGEEHEKETLRRFIQDLYPNGFCSYVSDTWNLWRVLTKYAVELKDVIMSRNGKLVFRPDSGDPPNIICGKEESADTNEKKGVIQILMEQFGYTTNSAGYSKPDPHVGAIYGDSITLQRARDICRRLMDKKICPSSMVFGIGSFTYEFVTRDTLYWALKATYGIVNGVPRNMFKKPITDDGAKFSAKGICKVIMGEEGIPKLIDESESLRDQGMLKPLYLDGVLLRTTTWDKIRKNVGVWNA